MLFYIWKLVPYYLFFSWIVGNINLLLGLIFVCLFIFSYPCTLGLRPFDLASLNYIHYPRPHQVLALAGIMTFILVSAEWLLSYIIEHGLHNELNLSTMLNAHIMVMMPEIDP